MNDIFILTLSKSKIVSIVDSNIVGLLLKHKWYLNKGYVLNVSKAHGTRQYLHRFIMEANKGDLIDHINGNPLDNRKCNLRFVTDSQNCINRGKFIYPNTTSKYKGVTLRRNLKYSKRKWIAKIKSKFTIYIGSYITEEEAAIAYNKKAVKLFGNNAYLNKI